MRMALRSFIAVAAAGLTLAPAALADTATSDLYLVRDACGANDTLPPDPRLAFDLGASTLGCGSTLAFAGGSTTHYPARQGMPVTLDPARPIYVAVSTGSFTGPPLGGLGEETVSVTLTGKKTVGPTTFTLGAAEKVTAAADMLRTGHYLAEFEFPVTETTAGTYQSLNLALQVGGSQFSGFVDHDGSSLVSLPVFDSSVPAE